MSGGAGGLGRHDTVDLAEAFFFHSGGGGHRSTLRSAQ